MTRWKSDHDVVRLDETVEVEREVVRSSQRSEVDRLTEVSVSSGKVTFDRLVLDSRRSSLAMREGLMGLRCVSRTCESLCDCSSAATAETT